MSESGVVEAAGAEKKILRVSEMWAIRREAVFATMKAEVMSPLRPKPSAAALAHRARQALRAPLATDIIVDHRNSPKVSFRVVPAGMTRAEFRSSAEFRKSARKAYRASIAADYKSGVRVAYPRAA
jgi:hypothetical protein